MTFPFRRLSAVLLICLAVVLLAPYEAEACGTACNMPEAPDCADCQYTFFSRTRCSRMNCYTCFEYDCWVANPALAGEQLATAQDGSAGTCAAVSETVSPAPKVIRVQILPARS
jgi:hypothetical protein